MIDEGFWTQVVSAWVKIRDPKTAAKAQDTIKENILRARAKRQRERSLKEELEDDDDDDRAD